MGKSNYKCNPTERRVSTGQVRSKLKLIDEFKTHSSKTCFLNKNGLFKDSKGG
jgi:hypothetical protein